MTEETAGSIARLRHYAEGKIMIGDTEMPYSVCTLLAWATGVRVPTYFLNSLLGMKYVYSRETAAALLAWAEQVRGTNDRLDLDALLARTTERSGVIDRDTIYKLVAALLVDATQRPNAQRPALERVLRFLGSPLIPPQQSVLQLVAEYANLSAEDQRRIALQAEADRIQAQINSLVQRRREIDAALQ